MVITLRFDKSKEFFEKLNNSWMMLEEITPGT
jgi:hypothetical protein